MRKRLYCILVIFSLILSLFTSTEKVEAASWSTEVSNTHNEALRLAKKTSFNGLCGSYVYYELKAKGIYTGNGNSKYEKAVNGNEWWGLLSNSSYTKSSGGYTLSKYQGSNCLDTLSDYGRKNVYNIIVSYKCQQWYDSNQGKYYLDTSRPGAGHVVFIHAIENGIVYFSECYTYRGKKEGTPHELNYTTFKNSYKSLYSEAKGAIVFSKGTAVSDTPIGYLDGIESICGGKIIHVSGWAYDPDSPSTSIDIHAYVGDTAVNPNEFAANFKADKVRTDVNTAFGITGNHGFDAYIPTNKTGTPLVNLFAINIGAGNGNPIIDRGSQRLTININSSHSWDEGKITKQPSMSGDGVKTYTCKICGGKKEEKVINEPIGKLDCIESLCGGKIIHVYGWAFDRDDPNASLDIHVYVGGKGGNTSAFAAAVKANLLRQDVNDAYGLTGNHGFNVYIPTGKTGTQEVNIYAINIGSGVNNPLVVNGHQMLLLDPNSNHKWDKGTITKEPTCTNKGIAIYTCEGCGTKKTEEIAAKGHNIVSDAAVAATCTADGKTAGSHCSVCGTVITAQQTVKASGHSWDSGKITTKPTTTSTGIKTYTCTKCKTTKTEIIPKLTQEEKAGVAYTTHVQSIGWQSLVRNGDLAGTVGDGKRLEAIKINLENAPYSGDIEYRTHVQTYGWQGWAKNGAISGTSGQAKRLEAIQIRLIGEMAKHYDVYYRIQVQSYGWLGWAKNGEYSGSAGYGKRLEAIQIVLVEKGKTLDRTTLNKQAKITSSTKVTDSTPYIAKAPSVEYQTHVQTYGWQGLKINGEVSGTIGKAKRLEGIKINLSKPPYDGGIRYKTHIQSIGWQDWKYDGTMSGTSGQSKRLEAICIELTGEMAQHYDVYYRVHAQSYGWLGWAKNGQNAGTAGYAKRLEGIQIVLVEKGQAGPGATYKGITADRTEAYISK